MRYTKVVDLSWKFTQDIKTYPGAAPFTIRKEGNTDKGDPMELSTIDGFCLHFGTHIDCPSHMVGGGFHIDDKPAEFFVGEGIVLDCSAYGEGGKIGMEILNGVDLTGKDFVLFYIAWDKKFGTDKQYKNYPTLTPELARYLGKLPGIRGIGIETNNIDVTGDSSFPNHMNYLGPRTKIIFEAMTNMQELLGKKFLLVAPPLNVKDAEGSPVRAIALVEE
jgi:arylformamidase